MPDKPDVTHTRSRKQAIEDGVLVDVSAVARELGVRYPTALTRTTWGNFVVLPEPRTQEGQLDRLRPARVTRSTFTSTSAWVIRK